MTVTLAYVGLGANLGDREASLRKAIVYLDAVDGIDLVAVSRFRETAPWGVVDQPAFLNGACALRTTLSARSLLEALLGVEQRLGRIRLQRWGPREIDLDLLLFGRDCVREQGLTVPHPRLAEREFALEPLLDLDPRLTTPDGRAVEDMLAAVRR